MSQKPAAPDVEQKKQPPGMHPRVPATSRPFVAHISFSFAFGTVALVEILLIVCLSAIGYMGLQEYFGKLEENFYDRGKDLALSLATTSAMGKKPKKYRKLTRMFERVATKQDPLRRERSVNEVFLLSKSGVMLAHSDITMVTRNAKDPLHTIALKYNNEFFHSALLIDPGQVITQAFPYPTSTVRSKASHILQALLPENLDYSVDFATPVYKRGKPVATVHVIMNRMFMYRFLLNLSNKFLVILGIVMAGGLLVALILLLAFVLRARYLHRVWKNILRHKIENDFVNHEIHVIEEKVDRLDEKRMRPTPTGRGPGDGAAKDAILLD